MRLRRHVPVGPFKLEQVEDILSWRYPLAVQVVVALQGEFGVRALLNLIPLQPANALNAASQSINPPINQSTKNAVSQSIHQPINQSINEESSKSVNRSANQPINQQTN